jgi:UDP-GlcNAc:undecaprenyl-phosphate GlcNAc-1-phosphate transferase
LTFARGALPAAIVVVAVTPLARWLARQLEIVARPKQDRWHRQTIPLLGGVAIWLGVLVSASLSVGSARELWVIGGVGTALFVVGIADDVYGLRPVTKLVAQIAIACVAVALGLSLQWIASPIGNALMTVFWIVGVTNAFNLLDNMDGLCAGISGVTALSLCLTLAGHETSALVIGAAVFGAAGAFLLFNFNPASVFMGDSGSLFLGGTLATLAVAAEPGTQRGVISTLGVPFLLMLVPIFDTSFVTVSRKLSRRAASVGGRDHTSHRLVALGFSERQAVLLLYGLAGCAGAAAIGLSSSGIREANIALALLVVALVLLAVRLAKVKVYDGADFAALKSGALTPLLADVAYKRRVFEIALDLFLIAIAYYASWVIRFDRDFPIYYPLVLQSLPIVMGSQIAALLAAGVYRGTWRHMSLSDVPAFVRGVGLGVLASIALIVYSTRFEGFSRSVFAIDGMMLMLLLLGSRASFRALGEFAHRHGTGARRTLIYGAGDSGIALLRHLRAVDDHDVRVLGFCDDSPSKQGTRLLGLPVFGGVGSLLRIVADERPDLIILSTRTLGLDRLQEIKHICLTTGITLQQLTLSLNVVALNEREYGTLDELQASRDESASHRRSPD